MAEKGARARLEPLVRMAYIETGNLTSACERYGVSRQSGSVWKANTKRPNDDFDEWDKAREKKGSYLARIWTLLDDQLTALEEAAVDARKNAAWDSLTKAVSVLKSLGEIEAKARKQAQEDAVESVEKIAKKGGLSAATVQEIRKEILGIS